MATKHTYCLTPPQNLHNSTKNTQYFQQFRLDTPTFTA